MEWKNDIECPLFSVLIANHNNGQYLAEAIQSVYLQTYENWEIIILDDASTDNSKEVYNRIENNIPNVFIHYNLTQKGVGETKNKLISLAHGYICGFLDADDRLERNAIEIMVAMHKAHSECSLIYSKFRELAKQSLLVETKLSIGAISTDEDLLISSKNMVSHFATFKRSAYLKTIGINTTLLSAEDRDLYLKLEECGEILYVDMDLYQYRVDNSNSVSRGNMDRIRKAQYYLATANLDAYSRRITTSHRLYFANRDKYKDSILREIQRLKDNKLAKKDIARVLKYSFFYLKTNRYSAKSIKRIIKMAIK